MANNQLGVVVFVGLLGGVLMRIESGCGVVFLVFLLLLLLLLVVVFL